MSSEEKSNKRLFEISENSKIAETRQIPLLKFCSSPKISESANGSSSLTSRLKRRNLVHKSLDFNLTSSKILTPKVIKADHSITTCIMPKANSSRIISFGSTISMKNRLISRNLLLDSIPL